MGKILYHFTHTALRKMLRRESPICERLVWRRIKNKQLGVKFRRQASMGRYVVDFYAASAKLVIEIDGESHLTAEAQAYDAEREDYLRALGMTILRFTNMEVAQNFEGVLMRIMESLTKQTLPLDEGEMAAGQRGSRQPGSAAPPPAPSSTRRGF